MPLGVVVERREGASRWQRWSWRAVAVLPGAPAASWRELARGDGWIRWHAATLALTLHRKETEGYRVNLASRTPAVYVVLRPAVDGGGLVPVRVTASAFDAQDHLDSSEDQVDPVPMPEALAAWVQGYAQRHHVEEPFRKRRRERFNPAESGFGRPPPVALRKDRRRG